MLHYLIIADVSSENQRISYYQLCDYLYKLNPNHSQVHFIKFNNNDMPDKFPVNINGNYRQIELNNHFQNNEENVFELCKNFIEEYASNNTVFILIDCCLVNSPLNNISFNQYYSQEYTYRIYDRIWEYINSDIGQMYKDNTNWACFSRGNVLLDYLSRALIKHNDKVLERYKIKNLAWYDHICKALDNDDNIDIDNDINIKDMESKLSFNESLKNAIGKIK